MTPSKIKTMQELQEAQQRLRIRAELTKKEFLTSADVTTTLSRNFMLHYVLIPMGGVVLGAYAAKKLMKKSNNHTYDENHHPINEVVEEEKPRTRTIEHTKSGSDHWFAKLMLVALPFIQNYFLREDMDEKVDEAAGKKGSFGHRLMYNNKGFPSTLLIKAIPMIIPMLQQFFIRKTHQDDEKYVVEKQVSNDGYHEDVKIKNSMASNAFDWLYKLLPVIIPLIQQNFLNKKVAETKEQVPPRKEHYEAVTPYY